MHRGVVLGMPTLLELPELSACAALCEELGLRFIELNMNLPQYQLDAIDEAALDTLQRRHGLFYTLHLDERFDVCDFNSLVRAAYLQTALDAIALAKRHAMPVINMHLHSGVFFRLPTHKAYLYQQHEETYLAALRAFRDQCTQAIGSSDIHICVENCDGFPDFAQRGIELLLESDVFGLTLDIGHSHCAQGVDIPFLCAHESRLSHMHLHDAKGADCHLPIDSGELMIPAYLQLAAQHDCRVVIEVKSVDGLRHSMEALHAML